MTFVFKVPVNGIKFVFLIYELDMEIFIDNSC